MFTGIVQGTAVVKAVERLAALHQLQIDLPASHRHHIQTGASIAINGTCLTVTRQQQSSVFFDVMQETLRCTNLDELKAGDIVNFERAARIGDEIGGHLMSGHVHTVAQVCAVIPTENNREIRFSLPANWMRYLFDKGFIGINGCSLTVGNVGDASFSVYLIPETLRATTFATLKAGDRVNIEIDSQTQTIVDTLARLGYASPENPGTSEKP